MGKEMCGKLVEICGAMQNSGRILFSIDQTDIFISTVILSVLRQLKGSMGL